MSKDLAERIIREQVDTILDDIDYGRMTYAEFIADPTSYLNPHIMRGYARVWQWQRAIYNRVVRQVDPTVASHPNLNKTPPEIPHYSG